MEVRRIGPDGSAADWLRALENRVRSLETSPAGAIVIRETLTTTDPATGVSTVIGVLPDGSNGLQQFVNDTTPPEKPSNPSAAVNLGTVAITWDGLDYLGGNPPADYDKTVLESSDSELGPWNFEQELRGAGTAFVAGLPYNVERFFRLVSLDKNGNASVPSATVSGTPVPLVESPDISAAIGDALQAAEDAQTTADGKNTIYFQDAPPTGGTYKLGDSWIDTNDGNKLYTYNGTNFVNAQDAGIGTAITTANGKNKVYYQDNMPTGGTYALGDTWFDTNDGNKIYVHNGTTFVNSQDAAIGTAASAANTALTTANGKNKVYYQPAMPTGGTYALGDTWFDTDDGNKIYVHNGTTFVNSQDAAIGTANSTANTALTSANGKNKNYYQTSMPTGGTYILGDTWFDTDDGNKIYVHNGTTFVSAQDAAIGTANSTANTALTSANGKNRVYYQTSMPTGGTYILGDTWFDTDDGNKIYVHNGTTFVSAQDAAIATAQSAANTAQTAANGKNKNYYQTTQPSGGTYIAGDLWFDTDDNYKLYTYTGSIWQTTQDSGGALSVANSKTKTYFQITSPGTVGNTAGDIWFDTDDGNKPYVWNGSAWTDARDTTISAAQGTANTALTSANGKNKVYYQTAMPTGGTYILGDTWFDTDDGNKIYVHNGTTFVNAQDAAIGTALTNANTAITAANGKNQNYYQTTQPSGGTYIAGDLWFDTDDNYKLYTYTGSIWQTTQDSGGALSVANSKTKTYFQTSQPSLVGNTLGDIWIDTDDNNKPYVWDGAWTSARDATIATAQSTANTALTSANGKNKVYYQTAMPTGGTYILGDTWFDTDDGNKIYVHNGTTFVSAQDTAISTAQTAANNAQTAANGKNKIYYGTTMPTGGTYIAGDTWFDTDDGNKIYIHNGTTFIAQQLGTSAIANLAITDALIGNLDAAKITTGYINAGRIQADSITGSMIAAGTITAADAVFANAAITSAAIANLDAAKITTGYLDAARIQADTITGAHILGGSVTAADGIFANAAITSANIASLDATKITTGTLDAARIAAGTITTAKLAVGDFTDLVDNGTFETDFTNWVVTGATITTTLPYAGTKSAYFVGSNNIIQERQVAVTPGEKLVLTAWYKTSADKAGAGGLRLQDQSGAEAATYDVSTDVGVNTSYTKMTVTATIKAGVTTIRPRLAFALSAGNVTIDNFSVRRQVSGVLIENGAISAGSAIIGSAAITSAQIAQLDAAKITTGYLDAARIQADTITGAHILGGSVTAADGIFANAAITSANIASLDAAKITTGYLDAARIQADTITGSMIAANTITAADAVFANAAITSAAIASLDAAKITTGTLDAQRIASGSITTEKLTVGVGPNMLADPALQNADINALRLSGSNATTTNGVWSIATGEAVLTWTSGTHTSGQEVFQLRSASSGDAAATVPITPSTTYRLATEAFRATGTTPAIRFAIYYKKTDGSFVYVADSSAGYTSLTVDGWQNVTREWVAPADAIAAGFDVQVQLSGTSNGFKFRNPTVSQKVTGSLIVDGAISAGSAIIGNAAIASAQIAQLDAAKITTGYLDAARIQADTITGGHIAANSITAADAVFANAAIVNANIANLDAAKITTGYISAGRIQADTITGAMIAAGTITAADAIFANASIVSADIQSLDAVKITTGVLDANRIGAKTITANHILIADLDNLWENPDFELDTVGQQPKGIVANTNCAVIDSSGFAGGAGNGSARMLSVYALSGSDNLVFGTELRPVKLDEEIYVEFEGRHLNTTGTGTTGIGIRTYGPTKAHVAYNAVATYGATKSTTMQTKTGSYKIPAGVSYVQVYVYFNNNAETTNRFYIDNIVVRRKNGSNLIVDGAITTNKIFAGAVTATELATNAVTADKISAGAITSVKIDADAINGKTIVGATIKTALTGARWEMDASGLRGYGTAAQYFASDASGLAITGTLTSDGGGYQGGSVTTIKTVLGKSGVYNASGIHFIDNTDPLLSNESPAGLVAFGNTGRAVGIKSRNNGDGYDARVTVGPSADGFDGQVNITANSSIGNAKVIITTPTLVVNGYTLEKLACTFANSFANHASGQPLATAMVGAGRVALTGMTTMPSNTVDVILGYVAVGHRPVTKVFLPVVINHAATNYSPGIVTVETDGTMRLRVNTAVVGTGGYISYTGFWNIV